MSRSQNLSQRAWGRLLEPHPTTPVMYFSPFTTTTTPELDFNSTPYFANDHYYKQGIYMPHAFLRDPLSTSLDLMTTTYIPKSVMELSEDNVRPAYYPDLSDLDGYLHKGVSAFAKWICSNCRSDDFIPKEIVPIFDLKPEVDLANIPLYTLPTKESHIFIGASNAAIHVMEVQGMVKFIHLNVFSCVTNKLKVKYHRVSIWGSDSEIDDGRPEYLHTGSAIVIWNARNVHRPSFVETFYEIFHYYAPVVVVVTEARFDQSTLEFVKFELRGVYNVEGFGGKNGYSEVLLIWDVKDLFPWVTKRGQSYFSHQLVVDIESLRSANSSQQGSQLESNLPPSYRNPHSDPDDPTVHDWNDHLTPPTPQLPFIEDDEPVVNLGDPTVSDLNDHLTP